MDAILVAILRKAIFIVMLVGTAYLIDKFHFTQFTTGTEMKNNPVAIAILYGLSSIAVALA